MVQRLLDYFGRLNAAVRCVYLKTHKYPDAPPDDENSRRLLVEFLETMAQDIIDAKGQDLPCGCSSQAIIAQVHAPPGFNGGDQNRRADVAVESIRKVARELKKKRQLTLDDFHFLSRLVSVIGQQVVTASDERGSYSNFDRARNCPEDWAVTQLGIANT